MDWARILAYVTGTVDQELLARNEYLATENRILKDQLKGRLMLSDAERATLGEIGHRLGRKVLAEVATVARPDTILAWYRKLVARKFSGSQARQGPGRPQLKRDVGTHLPKRQGGTEALPWPAAHRHGAAGTEIPFGPAFRLKISIDMLHTRSPRCACAAIGQATVLSSPPMNSRVLRSPRRLKRAGVAERRDRAL
jgi:hypothetical protein